MGRSYFHLHLVSDSTGETLIAVGRAAAAQYQGISAIEHVYPLVRTTKQLDRVIAEIEAAPGIVLYTLVERELAERLEAGCRGIGSPAPVGPGPGPCNCCSPISARTRPHRPGAQHVLERRLFPAHRRAELHHAA